MSFTVTMNRKKKSILYLLCSGALIYYVIQVVYFSQEYSPLQVLSDARSEARRLLRFITLYHYQCNTTMFMSNTTNWPICTEIEAGINLESKTSKIAYSVGYVHYYTFHLYIYIVQKCISTSSSFNNTSKFFSFPCLMEVQFY
jgi:hypothetical protein